MDRKEFRHLSRSELIGIIFELMQEDSPKKPEGLTSEDVAAVRAGLDASARRKKILRTVLSVILVAAAIAVLLSTLLFPVVQVAGESMEPTLKDGDILLLRQCRQPQQGELLCISWQNKLLLKRVIALPGDVVSIDKDGNVFVDSLLLDEPYVSNKSLGECDLTFPYLVPEDSLFVLGDHRDTSVDSRSSAIGCVGYDQVVGKVLFRVWPFRLKEAE